MSAPPPRRLLTAELLSIGSELTVGETRDTNAGELARALTERGVRVTRLTALPDDLIEVEAAIRAGLGRCDLIVSTGGLGPTPDDLTREAIAGACGETPSVDPDLEAWLRELWARRGMPFPELNLKQAWRIPSAVSLANPNGTAPGWFVTRPDGRVIVALPGPPREMRPMWSDEVVPRLDALGLGAEVASRTYRLAGIGESQVAELLGEPMLRATNPIVATYARVEAVDVRISAVADDVAGADDLVETAPRSSSSGSGRMSGRPARRPGAMPSAGACRSSAGRWRSSRSGRAGASTVCSAMRPGSGSTSRSRPMRPAAHGARIGRGRAADDVAPADEADDDAVPDDLVLFARRARELGGSEVGLAVRARPRTGDTAVSIAISTPDREVRVRRVVFLTGPMGRARVGAGGGRGPPRGAGRGRAGPLTAPASARL